MDNFPCRIKKWESERGERESEREREKATYVGKEYELKETVYKYK